MESPIVTISGLTHAFGSGAARRTVLEDVSVDFRRGEIVIIMGPSGSGKTTLLTLAGALRSVQAGSVRVSGAELRGASAGALLAVRHRIGFIFQAHNLVASLTAVENVQITLATVEGCGREEARRRALDALASVGLAEFSGSLPRNLSGGQRQRVAIARALVRRPDIIMADEPTAALDRVTGREVVDLLGRLAREVGSAILIVTHDSRILDVADRIITLEDGRLLETNRRLEALRAEASGLARLLLRLACLATGSADETASVPSLEAELAARSERLAAEAALLVGRRLCANLSGAGEGLVALAELFRLLGGAVARFASLVLESRGEERTFADLLAQAAESLLHAATEALEGGREEDARLLLAATGEKGGTVAKIRDHYLAAGEAAGREARERLFSLASSFVRIVEMLHAIPGILAESRWQRRSPSTPSTPG